MSDGKDRFSDDFIVRVVPAEKAPPPAKEKPGAAADQDKKPRR